MLGYAAGGVLLLGALAVGAWVAVVRSVETPPYRAEAVDGPFELRAYPALRVAEVRREGPRDAAVRAGFRPLAGYIFARGRAGDAIAMTAPVTQTPVGGDAWAVQFIMPAAYGLGDLPAPAGADVRLDEWPARRMAAVRFSGRADDAAFAAEEARLRAWMAARGLTAAGAPPLVAYYDDPLVPGFLRRNELLIEVTAAGG
jgi:DNA gyrase inhibitor GyrI